MSAKFCCFGQVLILAGGLSLGASPAAAENLPRQIEVGMDFRTDAIMITKVLYRDKEVECGRVVSQGAGLPPLVEPVTPFEAGDDWLEHVTVFLRNQTPKTIVFAGIRLDFPETGDGTYASPISIAPISLGRVPDGFAFSVQTHKPIQLDARIPAISIAPHQTILIDLGAYADQIKTSTVYPVPFASLTKCVLRTDGAFFSDNMKWGGGAYWTPDADHPGKFKALPKGYFPGDTPPDWPPATGSDCASGACDPYGCCWSEDPIIIDLSGFGFPMTNKQNGVKFDFFSSGSPIQMAWTAAGANAGWLALDRSGDGRIDNGAGLFSNVAPQPYAGPNGKLGFRALAVYDEPANGGNGDGVISAADAIFSKLLVWVDKNHNGISEPDELLTMAQAGIQSISIHYRYSNWTDAFGNQFRYRSKIVFSGGTPGKDRYAYDALLTTSN